MVANQKKHDQVENIIRRSKTLILNVKLLGADTSHAKELLDEAKTALDNDDFSTAIEFAKKSMVEVISLKKQIKSSNGSDIDSKPVEMAPEQENQIIPENDNNVPQNDLNNLSQPEISNSEIIPETSTVHSKQSTTIVPSSSTESLTPELLSRFEEGFSYLVEENRANNCYRIFSKFVSKGLNGLCICRINPNIIKRKYHLIEDKTTVLWLTDRESSKEATISPSLESMIYVAEEFIDKNDDGIILLDGLEYLISNNSFNPVLRFIRRLIDKISETNFIFIIGVSPKAINEQELNLLERELNPVII